MNTCSPRGKTASRRVFPLLVRLVVVLVVPITAAQEQPEAQPQPGAAGVPAGGETASVESRAPGTQVSPATEHFRQGIDLYNRGQYREALNQFESALTLEPDFERAQVMRDKCQGKLNIAAAGGEPTAAPAFRTLDPASVKTEVEEPTGVPLSAEDIKYQRTKELIEEAQHYLENQKYDRAVDLFSQVLIIDPYNKTATHGLQKATIGKYGQDLKEARTELDIDRAKTRAFMEETKQLPEGADARGIRPFRVTVPVVEEEYKPEEEKTRIEEALDSHVSIEFEGEHIRNILDFIAQYVDINIVLDARAVEPPPTEQPATQPGVSSYQAPGTYMPGGTPYPGGAIPPIYTTTPEAYGEEEERDRGMGRQQWRTQVRVPTTAPGTPYGTAPGTPYGTAPGLGAEEGVYAPAAAAAPTRVSGIVPYIKLTDVPLREALSALLRPLNLAFSVQPSFIWVTTPDTLRRESFESLETRYYNLENVGSEAVRRGGMGMMGGMGGMGMMGGMGGMGMMGGMGGMGGMGMMGGMGGYGGGMGGYGGGMGGMGMMGGYGGGMGGYGGGMGGYGGGMGGYGGGRYGGGRGGGRGAFSQSGSYYEAGWGAKPGGYYHGGFGQSMSDEGGGLSSIGGYPGVTSYGSVVGGYGGAGVGTGTGAGAAGTLPTGLTREREEGAPATVMILQELVPEIVDPHTGEVLSRMIFNPATNQIIVHNTPSNHKLLKEQLAQLDVMPKQVSIEAKFLNISVNDLMKIGYDWNITTQLSDLNDRTRAITDEDGAPIFGEYAYDINGDGVPEDIPFYTRPDGTNVIDNTVTQLLGGSGSQLVPTVSGALQNTFRLLGTITDNRDNDQVQMTLEYLSRLEESELLSAPRVTTLNNEPAVISSQEIDWYASMVLVERFTTYGVAGAPPTPGTSVTVIPQAFPFGYLLVVTPIISGDNKVRLWLSPQVTERVEPMRTFTQRVEFGGETTEAEQQLPRYLVQSVDTNVVVHDGETLVLGGLITDRTSKETRKIPYLGDVPILGHFFRGKARTAQQSSLLIFVTVDIIDPTGARYFESGT